MYRHVVAIDELLGWKKRSLDRPLELEAVIMKDEPKCRVGLTSFIMPNMKDLASYSFRYGQKSSATAYLFHLLGYR